ncbi:MAG: hypothetical protein JWL83_4374 [Actinomycetia bacterium]|nr:hypothetical protein [Actinomycetes bacterium]
MNAVARPRINPALVIALAALVLAVPLLVALVVLHQPRWYPLGDIAQTELRVRDVWSHHPPLVGLPGRIGTYPNQGSHPGPLSFYALWPYYQLFGGSSFALQCASAGLQFTAMVAALWIAWRRGGVRMVLAIGAVLAVLAHNLGVDILVEPWNPYLPLMTWVVVVLAVWSVCCDDVVMLPVVAVAGSFCMQTHVSYIAPVGGLAALSMVWTVIYARSHRAEPDVRRRVARSAALAVGLGVLAWVPPVVEQITSSNGNLSQLWDYFRSPPQASIGGRQGLELLLSHLDPWGLVVGQHGVTGALIPGTLLLIAWAVCAVLSLRTTARSLQRLHLVLAVALVLELVALSRIFGDVFFYLMLWSFAITALLIVAIGWTIGVLVGERAPDAFARRGLAFGTGAIVASLILFAGWFSWDAAYSQMPLANLGGALGGVMHPTIAALHADNAVRARNHVAGTYLVTWSDPVAIGARGFAFVNELERAGFDIGASKAYEVAVRAHRVVDPQHAAAQVHLAIGADIVAWRLKPGARQVAYHDPRTAVQRAESNRLHAAVLRELHDEHLDALVPNVDGNLYAAITDPRMPRRERLQLRRIADLDLPEAVFIAPATD